MKVINFIKKFRIQIIKKVKVIQYNLLATVILQANSLMYQEYQLKFVFFLLVSNYSFFLG
jgi:hypothetical protein